MNCPGCGTASVPGAQYCEHCGKRLRAGPRAAPSPLAAPAAVPPRTNGMAVAALVLGILWVYGIGSILALVFGYLGRSQVDRSGGTETGRGMAVAGIVLGWVGVGLLLFWLLVLGTFLGSPDA